ncbi:MAG: hypothetical protein JWQ86_1222 [Mycobacterium sp.]|jgi:hypothetical protein|nr:hypothetical protein [Mycobacterium sp.]MDT5214674.1 hypothetical protein [Mycobacterium sp.]
MTFKLTYSDGQETDYDDDTAWEVDDGVLKMGRKEGDWTVLVSPSHWAVIEVGGASLHKDGEDDGGDDDEAAGDDDSDEAKNEGKKDDKKDDKSDD